MIDVVFTYQDESSDPEELPRWNLSGETPKLALAAVVQHIRDVMLDPSSHGGVREADGIYRLPAELEESWLGVAESFEGGELRDAVLRGLETDASGSVVLGVPMWDLDGRKLEERESVVVTFQDADRVAHVGSLN